MNRSLENIYTAHHEKSRERGFSIMKDERGELLRSLIGEGKTVLDIGCRDGALTKYFAPNNKVLGIDIDNAALNEARKLGIEAANIDLNGEWQALSGKQFDAVVAGEVLEHLYYPGQVVAKIAKLLSPGGMFMGSVPNAFSLKNRFRYLVGAKRHTPLSDPTHINHFHIDELKNMLQKHFKEVGVRGLGRYKMLSKTFPGLFSFDLFFVCRR